MSWRGRHLVRSLAGWLLLSMLLASLQALASTSQPCMKTQMPCCDFERIAADFPGHDNSNHMVGDHCISLCFAAAIPPVFPIVGSRNTVTKSISHDSRMPGRAEPPEPFPPRLS